MKTPREVLLGSIKRCGQTRRHPREVVGGLAPDAPVHAKQMPQICRRRASSLEAGWRQFVWSLRWHLAGLSAAWLVVTALSLDSALLRPPGWSGGLRRPRSNSWRRCAKISGNCAN